MVPVFLSVVYVVRNQAHRLESLLTEAIERISGIASDYELIVVDNASEDDSVATLKELTQENGLPNLQVYALTREVDGDTASWVGLENALGDFVAVLDPLCDDPALIVEMLGKAVEGADVVFARNTEKAQQSLPYRLAEMAFNGAYKFFNGIHLAREAPPFRILSKRAINFILQHPQPSLEYRHLSASCGFARAHIEYRSPPREKAVKRLGEGIDRGVRLLVSTTRLPMRLVTGLALFGALANVAYSGYVIAVHLFKANVAPGWTSLSLQQSGMFFLLSLVLFVLGEYILHMAALSNGGPLYHVAQEFTSARMTRLQKLNVEEAADVFAAPRRAGLAP